MPRNPEVRRSVAAGGRGCVDASEALKPCELDCCEADDGSRSFELADACIGQSVKDSICKDSFRETMIEFAATIAAPAR